jgi:N-methylhydantoinase B
MSNLTIGGIDPRYTAAGEPFTYYETAAGGMGARPGIDGISGVQTHMTNSLNTPIEALEYAYPFRVRRYAYRKAPAAPFKSGASSAAATAYPIQNRFFPRECYCGRAGNSGPARKA